MKCHSSCLLLAVILFVGCGPDNRIDKLERVEYEKLIHAVKLPAGFQIVKTEITFGEKTLATTLTVGQEGKFSKIVITNEKRQIDTAEKRQAAAKGYINASLATLRKLGLKPKVPVNVDLERLQYGRSASVKIPFEGPEGKQFYVEMIAFFTDTGFNVIVMTDNTDDLRTLCDWVHTIKEMENAPSP